ncbi:hypothetical protein Ga0074812_114124 [Parafrankia irregularis]|uniref:PknH-like extracellular domain-containing protein n=1 Tax=Parafrankia irregularis TaxID=795642 RepID=A0A0S4QQ92_9ACTN|nr:hypothetical protein [Parafrankia sp. CH37]CUU57776.1 hypothetical protein Ga0074812_114124 [Parafrankia irregularis]
MVVWGAGRRLADSLPLDGADTVTGRRDSAAGPWRRGSAALARGGLVIAVAALLASCQGGDLTAFNPPGPPGATGTPPAVPASPASAEVPLDAEDYVLMEGAITTGFTASPPDAGSNSEDISLGSVGQCLGISDDHLDDYQDTADGPKFTSEADAIVAISSTASIVSTETAAAHLELLNNPRFGECFGQAIQQQFDAVSEPGSEIKVVAVETPQAPSGARVLLRMSVSVKAGGETLGLVLDSLFLIEGRVEVIVTYSNVDNNPADVHLQRITDQIAGRLQLQ